MARLASLAQASVKILTAVFTTLNRPVEANKALDTEPAKPVGAALKRLSTALGTYPGDNFGAWTSRAQAPGCSLSCQCPRQARAQAVTNAKPATPVTATSNSAANMRGMFSW